MSAPSPPPARRSSGFFGGAGSFAGLEQLDQSYQQDKSLAKQLDTLMAREAAFVSDAQTILATYRADLSYQPAFIQPESRYFWITTFSVRPGQDETFASAMKTYVSAYAAAKVNAPWVVYELMAGGSNPTFYLIALMESYGAMDADLAARASVGGKLASPAAIAAQFTASTERMETHILTLSPQISYVPADFAQQDKAFWQAR